MGTGRRRHSIVNRRNDQSPAASARLLAELVDRHGPALVLYARQICEEPEDVVQEAFLEFIEQPASPENVAAWLFQSSGTGLLIESALRGAGRIGI